MASSSARPVAPWIVSIAALAVAIASWLRAPAPPAPPVAEPVQAGDPFETGLVQRELASLDERVLGLEAAVARLGRGAPAGAAPAPGAVDAGTGAPAPVAVEVEQLSQQLDAIDRDVSRIALDRALASEEGQTRLRSLIREERERVEAEDRARWRTRSQDFTKDFVEQFAKEANLTEQQRDGVERIMLRSQEQRAAIAERMRAEGARPREFREEMRTNRERTEAALKQHLNDDQLELFRQKREEMRRGGGFGRP